MPLLIEREELSLVLDEDIAEDRFSALYNAAMRVVSSGYTGDPAEATGRAAQVVSGVLLGVMVRIASNPKGARQLSAGGAGMTFGGADDSIAKVFSLTADERMILADISAPAVSARTGAFTIRPW